MAWDAENLTVVTSLAGRPVEVDTELVVMRRLRRGDRFLGLAPDQQLYEVTEAPAWAGARERRRWVWVRDLSMTDRRARDLVARREVEDGTDPRDGFFADGQAEALVKKVLRLRPGR